jgi:dihydrofolate reductase
MRAGETTTLGWRRRQVMASSTSMCRGWWLSDPSWPTARIVHEIDEIRTLKQQPGQAVYVVGGPGSVTSLINAGLLDELRLIVHPVVTGARAAVFGGIAERMSLELVSAEPTTSGRVNLAYRLGAPSAQTAE